MKAEQENLALWIVNDPEDGLHRAMQLYAPMVKGILQCILPGRPQDVEECCADVFVSLWRHAETLCTRRVSVKAWLIVTGRNTGINRYRALRRRAEVPLPDDVAEAVEDLSGVPDEAAEAVEALVAAMEPPDRDIFLRKYYLMQSSREIASALGLTVANVNTRLYRGRERLRAQLDRKGVHSYA